MQTDSEGLRRAGRASHSAGDLAEADRLLVAAVTAGDDEARPWLGLLRAHQSRHAEALELVAAPSSAEAQLVRGYALALSGRPAEALDAFEAAAADLPERAGNYAGWVLRNVGEPDEAMRRHRAALEVAGRTGADELAIAALEDIAEDALQRGELHVAWRRLEEAESSLVGDLEFGWRLALRLRLLQGRVALARGDAESARTYAKVLTAKAAGLGVPRYESMARLLGHRARAASGEPVDEAVVARDLDELDRTAPLETGWWTATVGADLNVPSWVERASERMTTLRRDAETRLDRWRVASS